MKKNLLTGFVLVTTSLSVLPVFGQPDKEEMRLAVDVLKGKDVSRDKAWAVTLLEESQDVEQNAFVQNVLGIAYLHGLGTEADTLKAILYFETSGLLGFKMAYHNLGMYYKYASAGRQDFVKAYESFRRGAELRDPSCCYDCGFMMYKGLGCEQNYPEAVTLFQNAADFNHPAALYMLGLCYRNGYGVNADTAIGNAYLRQSADLGCVGAMDEMEREIPENLSLGFVEMPGQTFEVPTEMPNINPFLPVDNKNIAGQYNGILVTYDWSGKFVTNEKPLNVSVSVKADTISGLWIQGTDTIMYAAIIDKDGSITFDNTESYLYDRYSYNFMSKYRFEKVNLNVDNDFITGQLRLYSLDEKEPSRPMYVSLVKESYSDLASTELNKTNRLKAYANPYDNKVTLKFFLDTAVPSAMVRYYNRMGQAVLQCSLGAMNAGEHSYTMFPNLPDGYYTINLTAGECIYQTIIAK